MKSILLILLAVAGLGFGLYEFYLFSERWGKTAGYMNNLWLAIAGIVVALVFGIIFFVGRVNKEEEIHITQ